MNYSKIKFFTLFACSSLVFAFCGCDNSKTEPAEQTIAGVTTQAVAAATSAAVTNAAATSAVVTNAAATSAAAPVVAATSAAKAEGEKPKQPQEPEVCGFELKGVESIQIKVSDTPDLTAFLEYVEISPNPGPMTTDYYSWSDSVKIAAENPVIPEIRVYNK